MSESGITVLLTVLPGQRIFSDQTSEDGSVLAYRKGGDEVLFASWFIDEEDENKPGKGMVWIPVGEFSPDPEAIKPPNLLQEEEETPPGGDGPTETESETGPFGRPGRGRSRRPGV